MWPNPQKMKNLIFCAVAWDTLKRLDSEVLNFKISEIFFSRIFAISDTKYPQHDTSVGTQQNNPLI